MAKAGQRESQRSANSEAISHLNRALELLKTLPDTPERAQQELTLQIAYGSASMAEGLLCPRSRKSIRPSARAVPATRRDSPIFPVLVGLNRFYSARAELQVARELGEQCVTLAQRTKDPALLVEAHRALGNTFWDYAGVKKCNKNVGVMHNISTVITPASGNVSYWLTVSQHTDELCEFSAPLRSNTSHRYPASCPSIRRFPGPTALGIFAQGLVQVGGYLVIDDTSWERFTRVADAVSWVWSRVVRASRCGGCRWSCCYGRTASGRCRSGCGIWRTGRLSQMGSADRVVEASAARRGPAAGVRPV